MYCKLLISTFRWTQYTLPLPDTGSSILPLGINTMENGIMLHNLVTLELRVFWTTLQHATTN